MTTLQVKGPRKGNPLAVSYHTSFLRSQGNSLSKFLVTIRLGARLNEIHGSFSGKSLPIVRTYADRMLGHERAESIENHHPAGSEHGEEKLNVVNHDESSDYTDTEQGPSTNTLGDTLRPKSPPLALWPLDGDKPVIPTPELPTQPSKENADSESELEILEVREIPGRVDSESDSDNSELSSLDEELNNVLASTPSVPTQAESPTVTPAARTIAWDKLLPNLLRPVKARTSPPPAGYRNIPPNLVNTIQRELNLFYDTGADDELEVVGKIVFSLKDPYSATKIKLPVKATTCRHFECFDMDNFCLFHKLPHGVRNSLKKSLIMKSHESRKLEQLFLKQQQQIANGTLLFKAPGLIYPLFSEHGQIFFSEIYSRTPPLYKCPLCDEKFALKQLYISDIFNFFVKTTPLSTTRIELVEADRYKILESEFTETKEDTPEMVDLSDEEEEEGPIAPKQEFNVANKSFSEDFNDGLDDVLMKMSQGDGTWGNPMTLD